jgi:uncharacterized membrane protein YqjE
MPEFYPTPAYKRVWTAALALLESRLELFGLELKEEKLQGLSLVITIAVAFLFLFLALIAGTFALIMVLPDHWRGWGLLIVTAVYGLIGLAALWRAKWLIARRGPPFERTLSEVKKDLACF